MIPILRCPFAGTRSRRCRTFAGAARKVEHAPGDRHARSHWPGMMWRPRADHGRKHDTGEVAPNADSGNGKKQRRTPRLRSAAVHRRVLDHVWISVKEPILLGNEIVDFTTPITVDNASETACARKNPAIASRRPKGSRWTAIPAGWCQRSTWAGARRAARAASACSPARSDPFLVGHPPPGSIRRRAACGTASAVTPCHRRAGPR